MPFTMPKKSKLILPALNFGDETPGRRLARIRKDKGWTQVQLAEQVGIIQALISDYERDKLRLSADMAVRLALALNTTTDELLGVPTAAQKSAQADGDSPEVRRAWKKFQQLLRLPEKDQRAVIRLVNSLVAAQQNATAHNDEAR